MLRLAKRGQQDFAAGGDRRLDGLYGAVTSGRSVTFVLQNLRGKVDDFDAWYEPIRQQLRDDPVSKWFVQLRNKIEKQGTHSSTHHISIQLHLEPEVSLVLQQHAPPGAIDMFCGDHLGRSGWHVQLPDGSEQVVYFKLPSEWGSATLTLDGAPDGRDVEDLLETWLDTLQTILDTAGAHFLPSSPKQH